MKKISVDDDFYHEITEFNIEQIPYSFFNEIKRILSKVKNDIKNLRILDLCCGHGYLSLKLFKSISENWNLDCTSVDQSKKNIEKYKSLTLPQFGHSLKLIKSDVFKIHWRQFDFIFCGSNTLLSIGNKSKLKSFLRKLSFNNPNALLCFSMMLIENKQMEYLDQLSDYYPLAIKGQNIEFKIESKITKDLVKQKYIFNKGDDLSFIQHHFIRFNFEELVIYLKDCGWEIIEFVDPLGQHLHLNSIEKSSIETYVLCIPTKVQMNTF